MTGWRTKKPQRGSVVFFVHRTAKEDPKPRRGVVVRVVGSEVDIVPGFSERPPHEDFLRLENPSMRSGLEHTTYFDLRDVNTALVNSVEVAGIFPHTRFGELLQRLAILGGVKPE